MYHAIVRRRVVGLFAAVSNGDARPVLGGLAPRFEHFFLGDHALGGSRFTLEKTRLWYERLYRLLPDISFDLRAIGNVSCLTSPMRLSSTTAAHLSGSWAARLLLLQHQGSLPPNA
jgi:hypothetical protein